MIKLASSRTAVPGQGRQGGADAKGRGQLADAGSIAGANHPGDKLQDVGQFSGEMFAGLWHDSRLHAVPVSCDYCAGDKVLVCSCHQFRCVLVPGS